MKKIAIAVLILFMLSSGAVFVVNQVEQVVITRLGEPVRVIQSPGLYFKIPFIEELALFDKRMMSIELSTLEVTLGDKRRVVVDAFGRYKISDPLKFYQTVRNEHGVIRRLTPVVLGALSSVLGNLNLPTLLSSQRVDVMKKIKTEVNKSAIRFGIDMVDVRITKTDLPVQNSEAISNRMISERQREAKELRAKGAEKAREIMSKADRDNAIALAEADRKAQILLGEGQAIANEIYSKCYSKDMKFFDLYKNLEFYKNAFKNTNTTYILSKENDLLRI